MILLNYSALAWLTLVLVHLLILYPFITQLILYHALVSVFLAGVYGFTWIQGDDIFLLAGKAVITFLLTFLLMRWKTACYFFNRSKTNYLLTRWSVIFAALLVGAISFTEHSRLLPQPVHAFRLFCLTLAFLWYGVGNFFVGRIKTASVCILVSSFFFNHIVRADFSAASSRWLSASVDILICLGYMAFDKAKTILDLYPDLYVHRCEFTVKNLLPYMRQIFRAFLTPEFQLSSQVMDDYMEMEQSFGKNSKIFTLATKFFDSGEAVIQFHISDQLSRCQNRRFLNRRIHTGDGQRHRH